MKKTSTYRLNIEKPCEEQWDGMRKNDCGRFCQLCQKTVIDFTMMSDREIIQFIENHKDESICGRVANVDLNRDLIQREFVPKNTWKFKVVSCIVFLSTIFSSKLFAQKKIVKMETQHKKDVKSLQACDSTKKAIIKKTQISEEIVKSENSVTIRMGKVLARPTNAVPPKSIPNEKNVKPKNN